MQPQSQGVADGMEFTPSAGRNHRGRRMNSPFSRFLALLAIICVLPGCATNLGHKDLLDFLNDGTTRSEEVHQKLGQPTGRYEDSRIQTYRLGKDEGGYFLVGSTLDWSEAQYSLVLVFDADGILRRHSLIKVTSR